MAYDKSVRLVLIEYLIGLVSHVLYAYSTGGPENGRILLLVSIVNFAVVSLLAFFVKNDKVFISVVTFSVIEVSVVIGYYLNTFNLAPLIYTIVAVMLAVFMEPWYELLWGGFSFAALIVFAFAFRDSIIGGLGSYVVYIYLCFAYLFALVNIYFLLRKLKDNIKTIQQKTEEANRANESKMLFLANMSHEIRTPMNAICGMAELTLREKDISPKVKEYTENIQTASGVLISIVSDILDYSKMEEGNLEIIPVTYSLRKLVNDVINMMKVRMEDKKIEIRVDIQKDLPDVLIGDEVRIRQIFFNLLSNAVKFTEKGFIDMTVKGHEDGGFLDLVVSVKDSGIGIKKEDIPKLFNSFQQVDIRRARFREGTGLGLAISRKLLELMGGTIDVESTYGVGSIFTFKLTQKVSSDETLLTYSNDSPEDNPGENLKTENAKVLVVDDNKVNLTVAKGLLNTFGLSVDTCLSGKECLEILKTRQDYDIIFIDHMMPELDGIDTLNLIRADEREYMKKVPLIALTANVQSGIREMFINEGFDEYVPKPIDMIWMNGILRKYIPKEKQR